jgi:hypothetical protein
LKANSNGKEKDRDIKIKNEKVDYLKKFTIRFSERINTIGYIKFYYLGEELWRIKSYFLSRYVQ